jgi:SSS family solute:Na+ symporter
VIAAAVMIAIGRSGFIIRKLRALGLTTVSEYFEIRYSRRLRVLTGVLVAVGGILNMGVFLKVEGTFLAIITGLSLVYLRGVMTAILLLEFLYTVVGGMVSVVITDFIQFAVMSVAIVAVSVMAVHSAGWENLPHAVQNTMGSGGFNPFTNPQYGLSFIIFQIVVWLAVDTCWQTTAMRTFSTTSPEVSAKVFSWTGVIYLGRGVMPMMWGIAALTALGPGQNPIEAMPTLLARILPSGLLGLVVAGMLAATMSVNSSYLLGWSAVITQDIVLPLRKTPLPAHRQVWLNRVINAGTSAFVLFWGVWYNVPGPIYFYLNITATLFLSGALACVIGGLFWKRANEMGAFLAMLLGASTSVAGLIWKLPTNYAGIAAFALAALGMVVGSLLMPPKENAIEPA